MRLQLRGSHRRTYDAIFRHPAARNLDWRDVRSMLGALAEVVEEPNGNLKVTRNGETLVLHASLDKDIAKEELMEIRHFLERSEAAAPEAEALGAHLLVVIDHRQARIYKTEVHGSVPQRITPFDPGGSAGTCISFRMTPTASGSRSEGVSMKPSPRRWRALSKSFYSAAAPAPVARWRNCLPC